MGQVRLVERAGKVKDEEEDEASEKEAEEEEAPARGLAVHFERKRRLEKARKAGKAVDSDALFTSCKW